MTKAKLKNLGKGETGKGVNSKLCLMTPDPKLPIFNYVTFWACVDVSFKEADIELEDALRVLNQLVDKTNENGTFKVWQP
jgi:hypothetical protein